MVAPHLHTISTVLEEQTLPLLVQQVSGVRLLLRKTVRLPYVVCQTLTASRTNDSLFLIPLDNKGFYGAVSRHDEPTHAYATLSQVLHSTSTDSIEVLIDGVTPIHLFNNDTNKFSSKVLLPGEVITIIRHKRCPLQNNISYSNLCCFGTKSQETEDIVCVRDASRHVHLDKHMVSRFFIIHRSQFQKMESCTVYTLQDITQYQSLPKVVCSVSQKQTARDELPLPNVFRMIKVISDRVTLAYSLLTSNHPKPEDLIEISSYSDELFAVAESSKVTMEDIRDHQSMMAVRKAIPGKTISHHDYQEITKRGSSFPPKLPERPPTLRLGPYHSHVNNRQHLDKTDSAREHLSPHTVNLPTKSRTSILKKFSTIATMSKKKQVPSMTAILNRLHGKEDDDNKISGKPKAKKSLRGSEIVHILPDAEHVKEFDLSKPLFSSSKVVAEHSSRSTISSATTSQEKSSERIDEFIHSHYDFLESHQDSLSARHTASPSDDSSQYVSSTYSKSIVRFSDGPFQVPDNRTIDPSPIKQGNTPPRRSLRESLARNSVVSDGAKLVVNETKLHDISESTRKELNHFTQVLNDSEVVTDNPVGRNHQKPLNHLEEIKSHFHARQRRSAELSSDTSKAIRVLEQPQAVPKTVLAESTDRPPTLMDELRKKLGATTSEVVFMENRQMNMTVKKPSTTSYIEDMYMTPVTPVRDSVRSSAVIKLIG